MEQTLIVLKYWGLIMQDLQVMEDTLFGKLIMIISKFRQELME